MRRPLLIALALSGCAPGPDYTLPQLDLPSVWRSADKERTREASGVAQTVRWWELFGDETLNALTAQALDGNKDLAAVQARLEQARAERQAALSALLPDISASGGARREDLGLLSGNRPVNIYEASFDAAWEIDIFGGAQRKLEASDASLEATQAAKESVMLSLAGEVARNYLDARESQSQLLITQHNLASQEKTLELVRAQQQAGLISHFDVSQAETLAMTTRAQIPVHLAAFAAARNRLATLAGKPPGAFDDMLQQSAPVPVLPETLLLESPASVIATRPDLREAERNLAAATALQGAAIADLYPRLSLSGLLGRQNASSLPASTIWSAASGLAMPVFDFGRIRARIDAADARQREALAAYEQAALRALEEVETALSSYHNEEQRRQSLEAAAQSSERAVSIADDRYRKGTSAYLDVLVAQRDLYVAQAALARSRADVSRHAVALLKALGGAVSAAPVLPSDSFLALNDTFL